MFNIHQLIFVFFVSFLITCTSSSKEEQDCEVAPQFQARFEYYFNYMNDNYKEAGVLNGYMIRAISFMSQLTEINSNANFGDVSVYHNYSDFKKDMSKWRKWYNENRCNVTDAFIDSLENSIIKSTTWIDSPYNSPTDTIEY